MVDGTIPRSVWYDCTGYGYKATAGYNSLLWFDITLKYCVLE